MATDNRRTGARGSSARGGPRGRTGPGRDSRARVPAAAAPEAAQAQRPRLTGRAAILVLVLAVLTVSYASSAKAYLQQRDHLDDLREQIAQRQSSIDVLEREKRRWADPSYVRQQAREIGYVMPGETSYVVLDEDGEPLESEAVLADPSTVGDQTPEPWWADAWASVETAGDPPRDPGTPPATEIDGSEEPGAGE